MKYSLVFIFAWCIIITAEAQKIEKKSARRRPNIIFIMSDDHAYQAISAYGYGLNQTPNIDLLAKQGMLFNRAFVNNSLCAPSRAAIITGKYSHLNGIKGNGTEEI